MTPDPSATATVTVGINGAKVTLTLAGELDEGAGRSLVAATRAALAREPDRVDLDLRGLHAWTAGGARALVECRSLCRDLPAGLHYRTGQGPGRDALLAAYA